MCGVFGWFATSDKPVHLPTLRRVAIVTEQRGHHAWGLAWIDSLGRLKTYKQPGAISASLDLLTELAADARVLIGHCRYATMGHPAFNANNHPHPHDGGWFVHNGQIGMTRSLREEYSLRPQTDCDSEYIGLLMERHQGPMLGRLRSTVSILTDRKMVVLGLWHRPDRLLAFRRTNPLHVSAAGGGYWLASLPEGMPGKVRCVTDNTLIEITRKKGFKHEAIKPVDTLF